MTTSFSLTTENAIDEAITLAGGQPSQFEELRSARIKLNLLFSEWQTQGVNLWKVDLVEIDVPTSTMDVSVSTNIHEVLDVAWRTSTVSNINDLQMDRISYTDYLNLNNKHQPANRPTVYLVEKLKDRISIKLWQIPSVAGKLLIWAVKRIEDVTPNMDETPDVPFKFISPMIYGLAFKLYLSRFDGSEAMKAKLEVLKKMYDDSWRMATDDDTDRTSFKISPSLGY